MKVADPRREVLAALRAAPAGLTTHGVSRATGMRLGAVVALLNVLAENGQVSRRPNATVWLWFARSE